MPLSPVLIALIASALVLLLFGFFYWRRERKRAEARRTRRIAKKNENKTPASNFFIPHIHDIDDTLPTAHNKTSRDIDRAAASSPSPSRTSHLSRSNSWMPLISNAQHEPAPTIYLNNTSPSKTNRSNTTPPYRNPPSDPYYDSLEAKLLRSRSSPNKEIPAAVELGGAASIPLKELPPRAPIQKISNASRIPASLIPFNTHLKPLDSVPDLISEELEMEDETETRLGISHLPRPLGEVRAVIADPTSSSARVVTTSARSTSPFAAGPSPVTNVLTSPMRVGAIEKTTVKRVEASSPRQGPVASVSCKRTPSISHSSTSSTSASNAKDKSTLLSLAADATLMRKEIDHTMPLNSGWAASHNADSFQGKEELTRVVKGPQALLTRNLHNLTEPVFSTFTQSSPEVTVATITTTATTTAARKEPDSPTPSQESDEEMTTAHLVLLPYLQGGQPNAAGTAAALPVPPVPTLPAPATVQSIPAPTTATPFDVSLSGQQGAIPPNNVPPTPAKSSRREGGLHRKGSIDRSHHELSTEQQQQPQPFATLATIPEISSSPISKHDHSHHPSQPPMIATRVDTRVAVPPRRRSREEANSLPAPISPPPRRSAARPGLHGRDMSSSSSSSSTVCSPTQTLSGTPTSTTTPKSPLSISPTSQVSLPSPPVLPALPHSDFSLGMTGPLATLSYDSGEKGGRVNSPSPSNTSSNISIGISIISSTYSTAASSGVTSSAGGRGGRSSISSVTSMNAANSPILYERQEETVSVPPVNYRQQLSGSVYHDDFLKKYYPSPALQGQRVDEEEYDEDEDKEHDESKDRMGLQRKRPSRQDTLVDIERPYNKGAGEDWSYKKPTPVNHPQAPEGVGTKLSLFNYYEDNKSS